jgi:hypothetical protein
MTAPTSAYEAWVTALRTWRDDPRHDMSALPTLVVDSLPPSAYDRLLGHMQAAHQHVMTRWSETFARDWGRARDEHERARALIATRLLLARRLQLAGHPGLPEVIRTEFTNGVVRDIQQLQTELEDAAARPEPGARIDRTQQERTLQLLRTNRLTAILEPGFSLEALLEGRLTATPATTAAAAVPAPDSDVPDQPARRRRVILIDD